MGYETFTEAADGSIEVTLVRAGASGNRNFYPDATLREAVPMFEGVRVFVKSDAVHTQGGGKDVNNLIGGIYLVRFVEGAAPDTGALVGTFKPISSTDAVVVKMTEAVRRGMQGLMGLSIDATARTKQRRVGKDTLREATKFVKVNSVDLIVEPGAGGGLDRLTEAAADLLTNGDSMKTRMYEAIKAKNPVLAATLDIATATDEQVMAMYEAVMAHSAPATGSLQRVTEGQADDAPVTRAELQLMQMRTTALRRVTESKLPDVAKARLSQQFEQAASLTEAQIDAAIKGEGEYLAKFTESGSVRVPAFGAGSIVVGDRSVLMRDMMDAFFDKAHKDHRKVHSFKECYVQITGDREITGELRHCDMSRLAESLGDEFRESIASTTFANALGNSITRRMMAVYAGMTDLETWKKVATWGPVNDFRTQERTRIGGYGNLPAVTQGAAYAALTSPSDGVATYAATKRGGTEDVTMEAIINDDVQVIRRIPTELALAAKNTLYEFVFDFFRTNPTIYDTVALYHASHNNLFTAAFSAAEVSTHRLSMLKQTRAGSAKRLATAPRTLLVPFDMQEAAINLFNRNTNLDKTFQQTWNLDVIAPSYWTDVTDWCTVADPNIMPVIEIGFLQGKEDPELFVQDMPGVGSLFSNDKVTYKIRHIYGGNVLVDGEKATTKAVVAG